MSRPANLPAFKDWLQKTDEKALGTSNIYGRFLTRCAEHYDQPINENSIRTDSDVERIISEVSETVNRRGRWKDGTFNRHDITDNLTPALRAYLRFVQDKFVNASSSKTHSSEPTIHHQALFEEYYKEGNRFSVHQYLSSLRRAARLLNQDISPATVPNVAAVDSLLARMRQGQYKNEKFGPVGTALRRYAEMVERNFSQNLQVADDIPDDLPQWLKAEVSRVVRDVGLVKEIKELNEHTCQVCGIRLELSPGRFYSEGHHLKPLAKKHDGPDVHDNILCVCPNCHVKLDFAAIKIDPAKLRKVSGHNVRQAFIDYHNGLCK